jgi:hypothetical protein
VKAGADLAGILNSGPGVGDIKDFTKKDVVVVWGGTADVSRNESIKRRPDSNKEFCKREHPYKCFSNEPTK